MCAKSPPPHPPLLLHHLTPRPPRPPPRRFGPGFGGGGRGEGKDCSKLLAKAPRISQGIQKDILPTRDTST
ncbi:hypothetical protein JOQ06_020654, partial [Pogonophryne albipinna]